MFVQEACLAELSPIPYRVPIADANGLIDRNWQQWFEALLARVGGVGDVGSVDELEAASEGNEFNEEHATLAHLERALDNLNALQIFGNAIPQVRVRDDVDFDTPTPAELHVLRERVQNLETLSVFAL